MHRLATLSLVLLLTLPSAWVPVALAGEEPASKAEMVSEATTIAAGSTFSVALRLEHPAGWHNYYLNSGGIEQSPAIEWTLPAGFTAGPIQWPVPEVTNGYFGKSFVYSGSLALLVDITAPANLAGGTSVDLTAKASWQICAEQCLNEAKTFTLTLPTGPALVKDPALAAVK